MWTGCLCLTSWLLMCLVFHLQTPGGSAAIPTHPSAEKDLMTYLEGRVEVFGKSTRPKVNTSEPTDVFFGFRLIQLDLDEKANILHTSVWCRYRWYDEYLLWNKSEFAGTKRIVFPAQDLWKPDVALVNTADTQVDERLTEVSLNADGRIFWAPHRMYRSACLLDLTNYPFDSHTCDMWFQSLSYSDRLIQLHPYPNSPLDMETYLSALKDAGDWEISSNITERVERPREKGAILMYSRRNALLFQLTLRRRTGFSTYLLTLPPVVLSIINSLVFCLPQERPDRHSLATSVFGSFMVLLLILVESAPPTSTSVPKLGVFYAFNILLIIASIFLSVLVVNIHSWGANGQRPPRWIRVLFLRWVSSGLLFHGCCKGITRSRSFQSDLQSQDNRKIPNPFSIAANKDQDMSWQQKMLHIENQVNSLENALVRTVAEEREKHSFARTARVEWKMLANVLDRLFFVLYLLAVVLSIVFLYPRP